MPVVLVRAFLYLLLKVWCPFQGVQGLFSFKWPDLFPWLNSSHFLHITCSFPTLTHFFPEYGGTNVNTYIKNNLSFFDVWSSHSHSSVPYPTLIPDYDLYNTEWGAGIARCCTSVSSERSLWQYTKSLSFSLEDTGSSSGVSPYLVWVSINILFLNFILCIC